MPSVGLLPTWMQCGYLCRSSSHTVSLETARGTLGCNEMGLNTGPEGNSGKAKEGAAGGEKVKPRTSWQRNV